MALENIVSEVDLEVYNHDQIVPGIKAISGDSVVRYVRANLYNNGEIYVIEDENVVATLHALRPDHTLVIGPAEYSVNTYLISPEYTPVSETVEELQSTWYYIDNNGDHVQINSPEEAPEGYEPFEESTSSLVVRWYYIDESGNKIYVTSGTVIPAVYGTNYELYAELSDEMLAVPGTVRMQFKITVGDQVLRTSMFKVNVGENLEKNATGIIDLTTS